MKVAVYVEVANSALRRAIEHQLDEFSDIVRVPRERCGVVVTTTRDSGHEACRDLVAEGKQVIVLAALPSDVEREYYTGAGTDYLPMGTAHLRDHLLRLAGGEPLIEGGKWPLDDNEGDHAAVAREVAGRDSATIRHEGSAPGTVR